MFLFYCGTTSGIQVARDLNIQHAVYRRSRRKWIFRRGQKIEHIINWGCSPALLNSININPTLNNDITPALSKYRAFELCAAADIPVPAFSRNHIDMKGRYLARTDGLSGGRGIEVVQEGNIPTKNYDFYVRYVPKSFEVRLHIFGNRIIHEQFKFIPPGSNVLIRNHTNGATFSAKPLEDHLHPDTASTCRAVAVRAMTALGLYFGAVDVIISQKGRVYFLEVNTAPGLSTESGTYSAYLEAMQQEVFYA